MTPKTLTVLEFDKIRRRLADFTAFSGGRRLALDAEPSTDAYEVRRRLEETRQARDFMDRRGESGLGGAHDMRPEIEGAERGKTLIPQELLDIRDTVAAGRRVRRAVTRQEHWPALEALATRIEDCPALFDAIQEALDDNGEVVDGASPALARIRKQARTAHDRLLRKLEGIVAGGAARPYLQEALVTQRGGRYVVPVKSEFKGRLRGVVHDTSDSGATVFVEPLAVIEDGNRYRELKSEEEKEVDRVLREISGYVAAEAASLRETIAALAALDFAFARAEYGAVLRAVVPEVVDEGRPAIDLPGARHPLLDPETVVPIDVRVGQDFRQVVITGPNTGGKTVALKTIGLLTLMAQTGMAVPAGDGAELSVFDGVYADIGDEQSIEQSLSTFSGHMTNIIGILGAAGGRSLVLLDELGAGTDPTEGAALAVAILDHLRARGVTTVASTHYSDLKVWAHSTDGVANASVEFDLATLRPTFELTIGLPGRSNALAIAERLGLPSGVIEAARGGLDVSDVALEDLLAEIRTARDRAVADRATAAESRRQADDWAGRLERAVREVELERVRVLNEARGQAQAELETAREAIERLARRAEREARTSDALREALEQADDLAEALAEEAGPEPARPADLAALEPGRRVRVVSFNQTGEVLRLGSDEAEVQLGRLRVTVPLADLELVVAAVEEAPAEPAPSTRARSASTGSAPATEVDLRGLRVEEGLERMEAHLDQAVLSGSPWVRVIHGHGTGAMKEAVRDAVRRYPYVSRSRPGERGEGGDGVTVVYLE